MTSSIQLTWTDRNGFEDGWKVYRSLAAIDPDTLNTYAPYASLAANVVTYTDTAAADDTNYYYAVAPTFSGRVDRTLIRTLGPLKGAPAWKPVGLDIFMDFPNNLLWDQDTLVITDKVFDNHPQAIMVQEVDNDWVSKGANVISLTDKGLQTTPTRTNFAPNNSYTGAVVGTPGTVPTSWVWQSSPFQGLSRQIVALGTDKGLPYMDVRIVGTTTQAGFYNISLSAANVPAVQNDVFTHSVYMSLIAGNFSGLNNFTVRLSQFTNTPAYITECTSPIDGLTFTNLLGMTATPTRFSFIGTATHATVAFLQPYYQFTYNSGVAIDFTIRISGSQCEKGSGASPPILTTAGSVTRTGNILHYPWRNSRRLLDAGGVYGFVKLSMLPNFIDNTFSALFSIRGGDDNNIIRLYRGSDGNLYFQVLSAGVAQAAINMGAWTSILGTDLTAVFAAGTNYFRARLVGGTDLAADTAGTMPSILGEYLFGSRRGPTEAASIITKKVGLKFGVPDATKWNEMYAIAQTM